MNSHQNTEKSNANPHKSAILLINLGSPTAAEPKAVRIFLREFLSDPRVVEIPKFVWFFILNCIVLLVRPKKSAHAYAQVWSDKHGSPLTHYTQEQCKALKAHFEQHNVTVDFAMRYGEPAIKKKIKQLRDLGHDRIVVLPLYPQFSATTTATVIDEVGRGLLALRDQPAVRYIKDYHDHSAYIKAIAQSIRHYWQANGQGDQLVFTFHGIPVRCVKKGDPYKVQCEATAQLIADELSLEDHQWQMTFQSRFGAETWLQPYTDKTLAKLGKEGLKRLDICCPGFSSDCLETLEEIAIAGKETFQENGGGEFHYIPALNDSNEHIAALTQIAQDNLGGWADVSE